MGDNHNINFIVDGYESTIKHLKEQLAAANRTIDELENELRRADNTYLACGHDPEKLRRVRELWQHALDFAHVTNPTLINQMDELLREGDH